VFPISSLVCKVHEEGDTQIFALAAYSVSTQGCNWVVVKANDTDIIIMGIYHSNHIPGLQEMWIQKCLTSVADPDLLKSVFLSCHSISEALRLKHPEVDHSANLQVIFVVIFHFATFLVHPKLYRYVRHYAFKLFSFIYSKTITSKIFV
jgi:hypothetical protein